MRPDLPTPSARELEAWLDLPLPQPEPEPVPPVPRRWLAPTFIAVTLCGLIVTLVVALVQLVVTAWADIVQLARYWPALIVAALILLLLAAKGGGSSCVGLHCGGCDHG